jgi:hypothetical protein
MVGVTAAPGAAFEVKCRGSKRPAELPAPDDKPCKLAKCVPVTQPVVQDRSWNLKLLLTPWRWFQRNSVPAKSLEMTGCTAAPQLNGLYQCIGKKHAEELEHSHPTFEKADGAFCCYFWYDVNDQKSNGWYFADEVASEDFLAFNPCVDAVLPPERGWLVKGSACPCALKFAH